MKKEKAKKYICLILFFAISLSNLLTLSVKAEGQPVIPPEIKSQSFVLMDADSGQVLFEKNMNDRIYPASITKIMTALLALERGRLSDIITMSYDAVWSIERDTSHIALDEGEQITLEQALYALAIESANDAANGIAELICGSMDEFARQMTSRAKELGALNTNFVNAHGLNDANHYTTAYDMALIMAAAVKIPEFTKIFTAVTYGMPPTNIQPKSRTFNRQNSLVEGRYAYKGLLGEKRGWTPESGYTFVSAARRDGRTLAAVVIKSPDKASMHQDAAALLDYGFNEFVPVSFGVSEFDKDKYIIEGADGAKIDAELIPSGGFNCLILKSLSKNDIDLKYMLTTNGISYKIEGKAVFILKPGLSSLMYPELGEVKMRIYFNTGEISKNAIPANNGAANQNDREDIESNKSAFSVIWSVLSVILQIVGVIALVLLFLYIRRNRIIEKRKRKQQRRRNYNNYNKQPPMY